MPRPTVLLTGAGGQVGFELARSLANFGEVIAPDRAALDLADADAIVAVVRETRPQLIVNAAAYTAVDKAETESAAAFAINGRAPGILAEEAKRLGAVLIHYSTDYVFDGRSSTPYDEEAPTSPLNVYGASKRDGECAIAQSGAHAAGISHQLGLRHAWKQFPADDTEARAGTRRTAHRRGPVRDAELVPHAVRRDGRGRRARACRGWPNDRACITSPRTEKRRGTASPRPSSAMWRDRASCQSPRPTTRPRRAARPMVYCRRASSRPHSATACPTGARRSRRAVRMRARLCLPATDPLSRNAVSSIRARSHALHSFRSMSTDSLHDAPPPLRGDGSAFSFVVERRGASRQRCHHVRPARGTAHGAGRDGDSR